MVPPLRSLSVLALVAALVAGCTPAVPEAVDEGTDLAARHADLARSGYEAFARGDMDAVYALMDPDIVWYEAESLPYGGVYHGPDAVFENVFMPVGQDWDNYSATPLEFVAEGERVAVRGEYRGIHREAGGQLVAAFTHFWRFENERLVELHQLTDTARYLAAMAGDRPRSRTSPSSWRKATRSRASSTVSRSVSGPRMVCARRSAMRSSRNS